VNPNPTKWCCVPVVIDDDTAELFLLTSPDEDPEQCMEFRVTQSTADLVPLDFELYQPSLQRMVDDWRQQKARVMQMRPGKDKESRTSGK
jgi:hypothetical protein